MIRRTSELAQDIKHRFFLGWLLGSARRTLALWEFMFQKNFAQMSKCAVAAGSAIAGYRWGGGDSRRRAIERPALVGTRSRAIRLKVARW